MKQLKWAVAVLLSFPLAACSNTSPSQYARPPSSALQHCQSPVPAISTYADAYKAAVINAERLNECSILHEAVIGFYKGG